MQAKGRFRVTTAEAAPPDRSRLQSAPSKSCGWSNPHRLKPRRDFFPVFDPVDLKWFCLVSIIFLDCLFCRVRLRVLEITQRLGIQYIITCCFWQVGPSLLRCFMVASRMFRNVVWMMVYLKKSSFVPKLRNCVSISRHELFSGLCRHLYGGFFFRTKKFEYITSTLGMHTIFQLSGTLDYNNNGDEFFFRRRMWKIYSRFFAIDYVWRVGGFFFPSTANFIQKNRSGKVGS